MKPEQPRAAILVMALKGSRYGSVCHTCNQRIRVGKRYVIDPEAPARVYHAACYKVPRCTSYHIL